MGVKEHVKNAYALRRQNPHGYHLPNVRQVFKTCRLFYVNFY